MKLMKKWMNKIKKNEEKIMKESMNEINEW